jgi:hypothetical protein
MPYTDVEFPLVSLCALAIDILRDVTSTAAEDAAEVDIRFSLVTKLEEGRKWGE